MNFFIRKGNILISQLTFRFLRSLTFYFFPSEFDTAPSSKFDTAPYLSSGISDSKPNSRVKGHLMFECMATVFCEICRSNDHAMCRCPVLKQPKPVVQLVGQAADALASYHIPHALIQPAKKDSRMALVSTSGKKCYRGGSCSFFAGVGVGYFCLGG
jgi:hypothetical protein